MRHFLPLVSFSELMMQNWTTARVHLLSHSLPFLFSLFHSFCTLMHTHTRTLSLQGAGNRTVPSLWRRQLPAPLGEEHWFPNRLFLDAECRDTHTHTRTKSFQRHYLSLCVCVCLLLEGRSAMEADMHPLTCNNIKLWKFKAVRDTIMKQ